MATSGYQKPWLKSLYKQSPATKDFLAGSVAGVAGVLVGQPLDTVRVRLQQRGAAFGSAAQCIRSMLAREGAASFFKGTMYPVTTIALQTAVVFQSYGLACRHLSSSDESHRPLGYATIAAAGLVTGALQTLVSCPVELLKLRMQLQQVNAGASGYIGNIQLLRGILRQNGLQGVFRGWPVTLVRDMPCHVAYFVTYEGGKELLEPGSRATGKHHPLALLVAGGAAGMMSWIVIYPLDVVKARIQATPRSSSPYRGWLHCTSVALRNDGWRSLFRGFGPTLARAFLVNAAIFSVYEAAVKGLHAHEPADASLEAALPL